MEKKGMFLTHRHISWVLSLFIMSSFFVFVVGYFLGKKKAVEKFYKKVDQDSLADHIYYSVCSMYENKGTIVEQESTEDNSDGAENGVAAQALGETSVQTLVAANGSCEHGKASAVIEEVLIGVDVSPATVLQEDSKASEEKILKSKTDKFYAELIGFGTLQAANRFANKLKRQGFAVVLKKRRSRSSKGKTVTWYQVITEKFDNKSDLIAFVDIIKDKEKLKGIRVVQC